MDAAQTAEVLRVFEEALSQIKWKLKHASKLRLRTDILALCSRMRPCFMVDYGGKMPELGDRLCAFISHCKKESSNFELLHVMVVDDMVYLIHVRELGDFVKSSLSTETSVLFVDLEHDPPQMVTHADKNPVMAQLLSAQRLFASVFHLDGMVDDDLQRHDTSTAGLSANGEVASQSSDLLDLSYCLQESQVTPPTLNGWLLGYPVIYLFRKEHAVDAVNNLSTKSLHIYQLFVSRINASGKGYQKEELMSFTVLYDLSREGADEPWAKSFLAGMQGKWEKCKEVWGSLEMEENFGKVCLVTRACCYRIDIAQEDCARKIARKMMAHFLNQLFCYVWPTS